MEDPVLSLSPKTLQRTTICRRDQNLVQDIPNPGSSSNQGSDPKQDSDPKQGSEINPVAQDDPKQNDNVISIGGESGQSEPPVNIFGTPTSLDPSNDPVFGNKAPALPFVLPNSFNALTEGQLTTIHNQVVHPLSHGISVAGTTLTSGAPPITVSGTSISFASSALVIGTSTVPLASTVHLPISLSALTEGQVTTIDKQEIQQLSHGISIAGSTLTPGAPPMTVSGALIAYGPSILVVGTSTVPLASDVSDPTTTTIAGQAVTIGQNSVGIAGTMLIPGAPAITVSGKPISLGSSALVIGTSTVPLLSQPADPLVTTVAGHAITAAPEAVELADTTLNPGDPGVKLDGTVVSLDTGGYLVVGSETMTLTSANAGLGALILGGFGQESASEPSDPITTTVAGHAITAAPNTVEVAGTTLHPGVPGVTLDGTVVSLNTAGQLIVGSGMIALTSTSVGLGNQLASDVSDPLVTTIAGQAITAAPNAVAFAGTTLTPGARGKTISGTLVSLNTAGQLVVGSKTISLASESSGLGGLIMGGFGVGGPFGSNSPSPTQGNSSNGISNVTNNSVKEFQGKAEDLKSRLSWKQTIVSMIAIVLSVQM